jgi:hypothetical protein
MFARVFAFPSRDSDQSREDRRGRKQSGLQQKGTKETKIGRRAKREGEPVGNDRLRLRSGLRLRLGPWGGGGTWASGKQGDIEQPTSNMNTERNKNVMTDGCWTGFGFHDFGPFFEFFDLV